MPERENVISRVNNWIKDSLRLKDISVLTAERKLSKTDIKPGVIIATMESAEDKQSLMKNKHRLKDSSRYNKVFIENDIPARQRAVNSNFRKIINALGGDALQLKGSRIIGRNQEPTYSTGSYQHETLRNTDTRATYDRYNDSRHRRYEGSERLDRNRYGRDERRQTSREARYNY